VLPLIVCLLPVAGAIAAVPLQRASGRVRDAGLGALTALTVALTVALAAHVASGATFETYVLEVTPNLWMYLRVDPAGALFGATAAVLWLLALVYSWGYMADEYRLGRYYGFFSLSLGWTLGVAYAGNLLTFLIFYELFSILTYPLIVHEQTPEALAAGTKYIIYILIGGTLVLLGIVLTFSVTGDLTLRAGGLFGTGVGRTYLLAIFWCFIAGFGVKAALVPLYGWVPDVHPAAPTPFSAVLSGVMVAAGCFGIMRVLYQVFGIGLLRDLHVMPYVTWIAGFTVLFGAILAVSQDDLKRRLAYSTISQMAYVTLGLSLLEGQAVIGALVHVTNHAFMKGALFLCAGLFIKRLGVRTVSGLDGAAKRAPVAAAAFAIAALGMIGTPPLSGFVSKWYLGTGMLGAGGLPLLAVLLGGALLAAVYLLPIVYRMYFHQAPEQTAVSERPEAPASMLVPVLLTTALTIVFGLGAALPGFPVWLARMAARLFVP
jgi:multicomponent Na+:H+ antiporter subunit D